MDLLPIRRRPHKSPAHTVKELHPRIRLPANTSARTFRPSQPHIIQPHPLASTPLQNKNDGPGVKMAGITITCQIEDVIANVTLKAKGYVAPPERAGETLKPAPA